MDQQRRRLPHVWAEGKRLFVTWHLHGSLPHALYPPPNKQNAGQAFVWMDRYLDSASGGPLYRKQQPIAQLVVDSIHYGTRSESVAQTHGPAILAGGILRPLGARRSGIEPYQRVH